MVVHHVAIEKPPSVQERPGPRLGRCWGTSQGIENITGNRPHCVRRLEAGGEGEVTGLDSRCAFEVLVSRVQSLFWCPIGGLDRGHRWGNWPNPEGGAEPPEKEARSMSAVSSRGRPRTRSPANGRRRPTGSNLDRRRCLIAYPAIFLVLVTLDIDPARATVDTGASARLVAFGGIDQRYAIVGVEPELELDNHRVFVIDLTHSTYAPFFSCSLPRYFGSTQVDWETTLDAYLILLGAQAADLRPTTMALERNRVQVEMIDDVHDRLGLRPGGGEAVVVAVSELGTFHSMAAYDRLSGGHCILSAGSMEDKALSSCSSCWPTQRSVNSEEMWSIQCTPGSDGVWNYTSKPCDCHAWGRTLALKAKGWDMLSSEVMVEPYALSQQETVAMERPKIELVRSHGVPSLEAYKSANGAVVIVGSLVHAPHKNSTHFPIVAWHPQNESNPNAKPSPSEEVVAPLQPLPQPGRPSGCTGCVLGQHQRSAGLWMPTLLLLLSIGMGRILRNKLARPTVGRGVPGAIHSVRRQVRAQRCPPSNDTRD